MRTRPGNAEEASRVRTENIVSALPRDLDGVLVREVDGGSERPRVVREESRDRYRRACDESRRTEDAAGTRCVNDERGRENRGGILEEHGAPHEEARGDV